MGNAFGRSTFNPQEPIPTVQAVTRSAVIYCRVSSKQQASNQEQQSECKKYCTSNKLRLHATFYESKSGRDYLALPELQKAIQFIRENRIENLVVYEISRIGRDLKIFDLLESFLTEGVTIHSVFEKRVVNRDSPSEVKFQLLKLSFDAHQFSENLSNRIKAAYASKKKAGQFTGIKAPYGFDILRTGHLHREKYLLKDHNYELAKALVECKNSKQIKQFKIDNRILLKPGEILRLRKNWKLYNKLCIVGNKKIDETAVLVHDMHI